MTLFVITVPRPRSSISAFKASSSSFTNDHTHTRTVRWDSPLNIPSLDTRSLQRRTPRCDTACHHAAGKLLTLQRALWAMAILVAVRAVISSLGRCGLIASWPITLFRSVRCNANQRKRYGTEILLFPESGQATSRVMSINLGAVNQPLVRRPFFPQSTTRFLRPAPDFSQS